jgi:putative transposase
VRRHHRASPEQLRRHLADPVAACDHARRPKTLRGLTPRERVVRCRIKQPDRSKADPRHHMTEPNG